MFPAVIQIWNPKRIRRDLWRRTKDFKKSVYGGLSELVFPPICLVCERKEDIDPDKPLYCENCLKSIWLPVTHSCLRCSSRLPYELVDGQAIPMIDWKTTQNGCQSCFERSWRISQTVSVGIYEGKLRDHVFDFKRNLQLTESYHAGLLLGHKLNQHLELQSMQRPEALVPMPIHWRRWLARGFNQAEQIALGLSEVTGIPCYKNALTQSLFHKKQGTLSARERTKNVESSIRRGKDSAEIEGKRVMLVDDVMTTGATLTAAAKVIAKLKPASIDAAIVARASLV